MTPNDTVLGKARDAEHNGEMHNIQTNKDTDDFSMK
jgi:hypothetical protein